MLRVSARTGAGLPELRAALLALARELPPAPAEGLLRLPIDRVFSMKGFGTVVTGTLVAGSLSVDEELEVLPSGRRARVRGLQVHGAPVERAVAGTRTAVNLAGVEIDELARGDVLVRPGSLRATSMLDVELGLLRDTKPLADGARVRVHAASAEGLARVRLLEPGPLAPGQSALAQLRLEAPLVAGRRDRLVIRSYSPAVTIGGAIVVDALAPAAPCRGPPGGRAPARRRLARRRSGGRRRRGRHLRDRGAASRGAPDGGGGGAGPGARRSSDDRQPRGGAGRAAGTQRSRSAAGGDARVAREPITARTRCGRRCRARSCAAACSARRAPSSSSAWRTSSLLRRVCGCCPTPWGSWDTRCASTPARRRPGACW